VDPLEVGLHVLAASSQWDPVVKRGAEGMRPRKVLIYRFVTKTADSTLTNPQKIKVHKSNGGGGLLSPAALALFALFVWIDRNSTRVGFAHSVSVGALPGSVIFENLIVRFQPPGSRLLPADGAAVL
jgi:hypothetical protein